jgi:hypothetical protein
MGKLWVGQCNVPTGAASAAALAGQVLSVTTLQVRVGIWAVHYAPSCRQGIRVTTLGRLAR